MPDEKEAETEAKEKRTVPAMVRTARGVADHAAAVLAMQWDKERKSFKDPITVTLALFTYAKLTAALLDEAEARFDAREKALEARTEKLEQQIAAFESWRMDVEKQSAEMAEAFEKTLGNNGISPIEHLKELLSKDAASPPVIADTSTVDVGENGAVVPLKPAKKREEKGGTT